MALKIDVQHNLASSRYRRVFGAAFELDGKNPLRIRTIVLKRIEETTFESAMFLHTTLASEFK